MYTSFSAKTAVMLIKILNDTCVKCPVVGCTSTCLLDDTLTKCITFCSFTNYGDLRTICLHSRIV